MQSTKIDWLKAQKDYISDPSMSYAKIAFKYGVSETAVKEWSSRMNWQRLREETSKRIAEKLPEKIAESISEYQARRFYHGKQIADRAMEVLTDPNTKVGAYVANMMLENAYKLQTDAIGLNDKDKPQGDTNIFISLPDFITLMEKRRTERLGGPVTEGEVIDQSRNEQ